MTDMVKLLDEIHPGEILLEDFMKPMGIDAQRLATDMDVELGLINDIVQCKHPITTDTAQRLGLFFGMEARFWLHLQSEYNARIAARTLGRSAA
jgi:addiction module HigA family antidote